VFYAYPNPNTNSDKYLDQVLTPRVSGSSFVIRGSQRVSEEKVTIGIGSVNLKVLADLRHSARFSCGMRISIVFGSSSDAPIVRMITKMNFMTEFPYLDRIPNSISPRLQKPLRTQLPGKLRHPSR
jgi:hypothetical protein